MNIHTIVQFFLQYLSPIPCLILSFSSWGATTDISNQPIQSLNMAEPNIIFILDDSGSMDSEVLLDTNDGALWWDANAKSFTDNTGIVLFNSSGVTGSQNGSNWYEYVYLFPNGSASDARVYTDSTYDHFAIPPTPAYAFLRDSEYNPIYYNSMINYDHWTPAYLSGASTSFPDATPTAARSHPIATSPTTIDLTNTLTATAANWTFHMMPGMVIPGATISGITGKKNGSSTFSSVTTNYTIPSNETWDVSIPYYPATFYVKDATCTSAWPTCATAPDGSHLRHYEIKSGNTFPSGRTYAAEMQNFANWFTYNRKRKLMLSSAMGDVLSQITGIRGGIFRFNNLSSVTMYDFNSTSASSNWQQVLGAVYSNPANSGTPTRPALNYAGGLFHSNTAIIQYPCQINSMMILTDGYANTTATTSPSYTQSTWGSGSPYQTIYSNTLADLALAYYTINPRTDLTAGLVPYNATSTDPSVDKNPNLHINTYALTLGTKGTIFGLGSPQATAPYTNAPTWPNPNIDRNPTAVDDLWHATLNGRGLMFNESDTTSIITAIQNLIADLLIKAGAGSSASVSNVNITSTNNVIYSGSYSGGYSGDLKAYTINLTTGAVNTTVPIWSASTLLDAMAPTTRLIATYNGTTGIPFEWANLSTTQQSQLNSTISPPGPSDGASVLSFLRGDRSQERTNYRLRDHVLGDIVDTEPTVVQGATAHYTDEGYNDFATSITTRNKMVYQGANDGILHAFDANTGIEDWAYVPNLVFSTIGQFASKTYSHRFFVDGTPTVGDVYMNNKWYTILVGGLRAGGAGYYALDITSPQAINETTLTNKVLWEFPNAATSTTVRNNIGLSYGEPIIAKTKAYGWVVLVTSGYNNTNGDGLGHLFVLDPATGSVIKDLKTTSGTATSPSGLAHISAYSARADYDATITYVYGGDLNGNMWRFDLSGATTDSWNVALLATLVDGSNNPQPITSSPELAVNSLNQKMVIIGTGRLLGNSDFSNTQTQTMYALTDNGQTTPTITNLRTNLKGKTITGTDIDNSAVNYTTYRGWYFDLPNTGERSVTDPTLALGAIVFNTSIPSPTACSSTSYQYVVDLNTGGDLVTTTDTHRAHAITSLGGNLASGALVVSLPSGAKVSITHKSDNSIVTNTVPIQASTTIRKVGWREILQ